MAKPRIIKAAQPKPAAQPDRIPPAYLQPNRPADYRSPLPPSVVCRNGSAEQQLLDGLV